MCVKSFPFLFIEPINTSWKHASLINIAYTGTESVKQYNTALEPVGTYRLNSIDHTSSVMPTTFRKKPLLTSPFLQYGTYSPKSYKTKIIYCTSLSSSQLCFHQFTGLLRVNLYWVARNLVPFCC